MQCPTPCDLVCLQTGPFSDGQPRCTYYGQRLSFSFRCSFSNLLLRGTTHTPGFCGVMPLSAASTSAPSSSRSGQPRPAQCVAAAGQRSSAVLARPVLRHRSSCSHVHTTRPRSGGPTRQECKPLQRSSWTRYQHHQYDKEAAATGRKPTRHQRFPHAGPYCDGQPRCAYYGSVFFVFSKVWQPPSSSWGLLHGNSTCCRRRSPTRQGSTIRQRTCSTRRPHDKEAAAPLL